MEHPFKKPKDKYPVVYLKDTDLPLPSHVVNNKMRYAYFKTLATGGKCIIRSCKDFHLSRVVAHKSLRPEIADDPFEQQRFLREARVTALLQHPNTIPIYELSRNNQGHYYFTMKLVEGFTLREILNERKSKPSVQGEVYDLERLVEILIQVCHALDYAHNHGVVHRDIKPANILIGPFGEVLILDWGLAKVWDMTEETLPPEMIVPEDLTLTSQGRLQGTALYMSPEQIAESKDIDHRTDIYSLGTVLYEVLTGKEMVVGETLDELLGRISDDPVLAPSLRSPERDIPTKLEAICMKCVGKSPDDRYSTARELRREFQAWRP